MFGIYKIANSFNDMLYIGSTGVSFQDRWRSHRKMLKCGNHPNIHLQRAWNKYGYQEFTFEIIESINNKNTLCEREQFWIDHYGMGKLYNICPEAYRPMAKGAPKTHIGLISPDGTRYENIYNLKRFCEDHSVSYPGIYGVTSGYREFFKGWTRIGAPKDIRQRALDSLELSTRSYNLVSPDGVLFRDVSNLSEFARSHNIDISALARLVKGIIPQTKGWIKEEKDAIPYNDRELKVFCSLISPDGNIFHVTKYKEFCRKYKLNAGCINKVIRGEYSHHKGWKLFKIDSATNPQSRLPLE